ncbi:MAG TPA: ADP-ribosylglycohydrolase family protein, partial [bacterium]|nr:ADP-ribosylglycohydrolase family protein [bacterium]
GQPQLVMELGEKFGRLMNYGDGVYGGQFIGGMYAEAFFETNMERLVEAGLRCIPPKSQYHECISDVLRWYREQPDDWQATWKRIDEKYQRNPQYRRFSCSREAFNIDAKINGAFVVMGLLYGKGDIERTIEISMRCGQDSDCNPSNATGILFTSLGFSRLPDRYRSALDIQTRFSHTTYNFQELIAVCERLTKRAVSRSGGKIVADAQRRENFLIPMRPPKVPSLEQSWNPVPISH